MFFFIFAHFYSQKVLIFKSCFSENKLSIQRFRQKFLQPSLKLSLLDGFPSITITNESISIANDMVSGRGVAFMHGGGVVSCVLAWSVPGGVGVRRGTEKQWVLTPDYSIIISVTALIILCGSGCRFD